MQQFAGTIRDTFSGVNYEVFADFDEEGSPDHLYVTHGRRQASDAPFNQPNQDDLLSKAAQELVEKQLSSIELSSPREDYFEVIDTEDNQ